MDSLKWVKILLTQNVDSLELFTQKFSSSEFFKSQKYALDSVEWNIAYYSKDTIKLRQYSEQYPNSNNSVRAKELIWEIQWPPVKVEKANSIYIGTKGSGLYYGSMMFSLGEDSPVSKFAGGRGPNKVFIWRDFGKNELKEANRIRKKINDSIF